VKDYLINRRLAATTNLLFTSSQVLVNIIFGLALVPLYLRYFQALPMGHGWRQQVLCP